MHIVWEMLSDKKIWSMLSDVNREIDEDLVRLMFIEIFSRLKTLEEENLALRVLLVEEGYVDKDMFNKVRETVCEYIENKDELKTQESNFFAESGVSFPEWVNFKLQGEFKKPV